MNHYTLIAITSAIVVAGLFVMYEWRMVVAIVGIVMVFAVAIAATRGPLS